ncbi:HAD family hydrolase [Gilliamella apicola]|uniref:HAD family hydrolase n=1 Tax=Gilliamella apicola TaxID=1196095 RepID=UPI003FA5336D
MKTYLNYIKFFINYQCISVIVERDDVTKGKTYPDPYLLAIKRLNIPVNHTIVFEDSSSDVKSAVAARTYCVGIGDENLLSVGAQFTIHNSQLLIFRL